MQNNALLYVKSEKIPVTRFVESVQGHSYAGNDGASETSYDFKSEDQQAIGFLKKTGMTHRIVNLSECIFIERLAARISGINETPTLLLNGRKAIGMESIKQILLEECLTT